MFKGARRNNLKKQQHKAWIYPSGCAVA